MDQLDFLAGAKVSGICLLGSTGEFLNYSLAERQRAVRRQEGIVGDHLHLQCQGPLGNQ